MGSFVSGTLEPRSACELGSRSRRPTPHPETQLPTLDSQNQRCLTTNHECLCAGLSKPETTLGLESKGAHGLSFQSEGLDSEAYHTEGWWDDSFTSHPPASKVSCQRKCQLSSGSLHGSQSWSFPEAFWNSSSGISSTRHFLKM